MLPNGDFQDSTKYQIRHSSANVVQAFPFVLKKLCTNLTDVCSFACLKVKLNNNNRINLSRRSQNALVHYLAPAILFLVFLFVGARHASAEIPDVYNDDETCVICNASDDGSHHGIHSRSNSKPALPCSESSEESDTQEESDSDEDDDEHHIRTLNQACLLNFPETLSLDYLRVIQNHTGVSLVILYHSWKGYLS